MCVCFIENYIIFTLNFNVHGTFYKQCTGVALKDTIIQVVDMEVVENTKMI